MTNVWTNLSAKGGTGSVEVVYAVLFGLPQHDAHVMNWRLQQHMKKFGWMNRK